MQGFSVFTLLSVLLVSLDFPEMTSAFCCPHAGIPGCCGTRPCNFFCCACDGGSCCPATCDPNHCGGRMRRSAAMPISPMYGRNVTETRFMAVDSDRDGAISLAEAYAYAQRMGGSYRVMLAADHDEQQPAWFRDMDKNANGRIEPSEFDPSLG